jgi:hypothetical protein
LHHGTGDSSNLAHTQSEDAHMMKRTLAAVVTAAVLGACSDGTGPAGSRTVSLSLVSAGTGPSFSVAAGDTIEAGGNTLVLERVQIVLREIELKRLNHDACDSIAGDDDGCEEFETGPLLVDLPLGGDIASVLSVTIDTGTYDELEFEIHKPSDDDQQDLDFLAAHPDFADVAIRVTGTFNGTPFVYETDRNAEQEIDLVPPLVITESTGATNVTLRVDARTWFMVGGVLVNPQTANKGGANESAVNENVKNSFEAFEDRDRDGDDSDEDH